MAKKTGKRKILKLKKVLFIFSILLLGWLSVRFAIGGPEDDWICVNGQWVRHGYPSAPMPETECPNKK
ncbi:MAG TPA: hypothetical protein VMW41_02030 [Candidatus Bathyarchaeia archaeon]|nr:hypothetical protein [Candidatus Bathyarchaeia archaeon]